MEQALLQAERRAEQEQVDAENEIISQLQLKLSQLDKATQKEKAKVGKRDKTTGCTFSLLHVPLFESVKTPSFLNASLEHQLNCIACV